jgi:kumamolisin
MRSCGSTRSNQRRDWMRTAHTFWSRWTPRLGLLIAIPALLVAACGSLGDTGSTQGSLSGACSGRHAPTSTTSSGGLGTTPITGGTGAVPATMPMHLDVGLNVNYAALEACISQINDPSSPNFGHYLSPQEISSDFTPDPSQVSALSSYLTGAGLTVAETYGTNAALTVDGVASQVEKAFNVQIDMTADGKYGPTSAPSVPSNLQDVIATITGLKVEGTAHCNIDNPKDGQTCGQIMHYSHYTLPKTIPQTAKKASASGDCTLAQTGTPITGQISTLLTWNDLRNAYGINNLQSQGYNGENTSIGFVEFDTYLRSDVVNYMLCATDANGKSVYASDRLQTVNVDVGSSDPAADSAPGAGEAALDMEMAAGLTSPSTKLVDYYAPNNANWEAELQDILQKVASDKKVSVLSISYGDFERDLTPTYMAAVNDSMKLLAAEGITTFVASGDCAAFGGGQFGQLDVSFPASAPYAVAVGGTTLTTDPTSGARTAETTWVDDSATGSAACQNTWGSTGGLSVVPSFTTPSWQKGTGVSNQYSDGERQVPDVAAAAINISFYFSAIPGTPLWLGVGGTSAAAPIWAAGTDIVDQALAAKGKPPLGGVANIYALANSSNYSSAFFDVTKGDNLKYQAGPGWDYVTGWGTPNFDKIASALGG